DSIAALAYRGTLVSVGVAGRAGSGVEARDLWPQNNTLRGVFLGGALLTEYPRVHGMIGDLLEQVASGGVRVAIDRTFPLGEAAPECAVHLAGEIAAQRNRAKIEKVNVGGTRKLIAACEAGGVRRIVFSSAVGTGDAKGALLDEKTELPVETEYGRSKQEGGR